MNRDFSAVSLQQVDRRLVVVLILFLLLTGYGAMTGALEWDEGSFLLNAEYFHGSDTNLEKSRPHALSYGISLLWSVTGESTMAARLLVVLFGIATLLVFYRLAGREFDDSFPLLAAFAAMPLMLYWSFHAYTDIPAFFFVLSALYLYREDRHISAGVLMAVATTVRYVFFVFAAGMALAYLIRVVRERAVTREFLQYTLGGVIGSLPFFVYSYLDTGQPWGRVALYVTRVSEWSGSGLFAATGANVEAAVLALSFLLPVTYLGWRHTPLVEKTMLAAYTAFFLFVSGMTFMRYWLPLIPILLLMTYRGLNSRDFNVAGKRITGKYVFIASVALTVIVSGYHVGTTAHKSQVCSKPFQDSLAYVSGQGEGAVVSDQWAVTGYVLDRDVHSPWTDYQTLHENYTVEYVVTREELNYDIAASFSNRCWTYYVYRLS